MWVYQQTGTPAHLPEAAQQLPTGEAALLPQPQKTLPPERSAPEVPLPLQSSRTGCNITCKAGATCLPLQMHILRPAFSEWNILRWLRPRPFCS